jgi:hypothetical protein
MKKGWIGMLLGLMIGFGSVEGSGQSMWSVKEYRMHSSVKEYRKHHKRVYKVRNKGRNMIWTSRKDHWGRWRKDEIFS